MTVLLDEPWTELMPDVDGHVVVYQDSQAAGEGYWPRQRSELRVLDRDTHAIRIVMPLDVYYGVGIWERRIAFHNAGRYGALIICDLVEGGFLDADLHVPDDPRPAEDQEAAKGRASRMPLSADRARWSRNQQVAATVFWEANQTPRNTRHSHAHPLEGIGRGTDYNTVLCLRRACLDATSQLACNDDDDACLGAPNRSRISAPLSPGVYYLFVDGSGANGDDCVNAS
jgi:hypothetical protein